MVQSKKICRWGFVSAANIARKNWLAIKNSGNGIVAAVASRKLTSSQAFIDECQATQPFDAKPRAIEGYEQLLSDPEIDAAYFPLPTGLRKKWVIRAAELGKHVMCEKPCAASVSELHEMIAACQANGVQFMDGVMFMHTQRLKEMRKLLDDGKSVGKIRRIASQFSFNGGDDFESGNIRLNSDLEPFGCLGDLGWYSIRFSLWAMNYAMPTHVIGTMLRGHQRSDSPRAVPMELSGELFFADGASATFFGSFVTNLQQWANVSGSHGNLHLSDFVLPYVEGDGRQSRFSISNPENKNVGCEFKVYEHRQAFAIDGAVDSAVDAPETNLFRKLAEIANTGALEPHWPQISMQTQQVMEAVMESAQNDGRRVELGSAV